MAVAPSNACFSVIQYPVVVGALGLTRSNFFSQLVIIKIIAATATIKIDIFLDNLRQ